MIFPLLVSACRSGGPTRGSITPAELSPLRTNQWIEGTIVQPWTMDGYLTTERWEREFEYMSAVGMDTYILQWTADSSNQTTIFPITIPRWEWASPLDQVDMALSSAQQYGMKVYLGLAFDQEWFVKQASDRAWLLDQATAMNLVADDLYRSYFDRYPDNFAGWYLNWEMDNVSGYNTRVNERQTMVEALASVVDHLHRLNPNLPAAIAPYFNARIGAKPQVWGEFWDEVIAKSGIDILMLQDGVGVGHAGVKDLPAWFEVVCRAAHHNGVECWDDLEIFSGASAVNSPAPTERIIQQIQAAGPFVDKIVSFSFNVAMSPEFGLDPVYYQSYKAYVDGQIALTNP
jgi:hypothetical protein